MYLQRSVRWRIFLAVLFLAVILSYFRPVLAEPGSTVGQENVDPALVYPRSSEIFSPRIYGDEKAPNKMILMLSPGNESDEKLFVDLYPVLQPLVAAGKVQLEIRLWAHIDDRLPVFLVAQCLTPSAMPLYLYKLFMKVRKAPYPAPADVGRFAGETVLHEPALFPAGLGAEQMRNRLNWCLTKRKEGMIYAETSRHQSIYDFALKESGYLGTAAVVNQRVFDGEVSADELIKALRGIAP